MALTAKQSSFIQYYADIGSKTYNNATQSAIKAGYSAKTANNNAMQIMLNNGIKQGIKEYRAKISKVLEHDRTIAIKLLTDNLARLQAKADAGDVQACTAITSAIRELNAISQLHSNTIITDDAVHELDKAEAEDRRAFTAWQLRQQLAVKQA